MLTTQLHSSVVFIYYRTLPYIENTKRKEERTSIDENRLKDKKIHMP
jgi:hypothetical protein